MNEKPKIIELKSGKKLFSKKKLIKIKTVKKINTKKEISKEIKGNKLVLNRIKDINILLNLKNEKVDFFLIPSGASK